MIAKEQVLSREQMAHLKELGVDTSDAGMCWLRYDADGNVNDVIVTHDEMCYEFAGSEPCPAYTATDILNKLPKAILEYHIMVDFENNRVSYVLMCEGNIAETYYSGTGDSLTNALYEALCWVAVDFKELLRKT